MRPVLIYLDPLKLRINGIQSIMNGILWKYGMCKIKHFLEQGTLRLIFVLFTEVNKLREGDM